jgi:hypothetical protein
MLEIIEEHVVRTHGSQPDPSEARRETARPSEQAHSVNRTSASSITTAGAPTLTDRGPAPR